MIADTRRPLNFNISHLVYPIEYERIAETVMVYLLE